MTGMSDTLFPANPTHGMVFEQKNGVMYQYDITIKAWLKLASDTLKPTYATVSNDGIMTAKDLRKLNRLLVNPPASTIIGNDCVAPYRSGYLSLRSNDNFITVNGNATSQNIDSKGEVVTDETPYQVHQHTYAFDFGIDVPNLMLELSARNQINISGRKGLPGDIGDIGDPGLDGILSGPPGDQGDQGSAVTGNISVQPEAFITQIKAGLKRAIVDARIVPDLVDERQYTLELDRQLVGSDDATTAQFIPKQIDSTWVLVAIANNRQNIRISKSVVPTCGTTSGAGASDSTGAYDLYYIDIAPILDTIKNKFISEIKRLRYGYQRIYKYWLGKMSDLFDEQKASLCCALEKCISMTKNIDSRKHMESVGATLVGKGKMQLHGRSSSESVALSSTRGLRTAGGPDLCYSGPAFPQPSQARVPVGSTPQASILGAAPILNAPVALKATVDPLVHFAPQSAQRVELPAGRYTAVITQALASIGGHHRSNVRIGHITNGMESATDFLDQGSYGSLEDARNAYEGLSISFDHDGGDIKLYLPSLLPTNAAGMVEVAVMPVFTSEPASTPQEAPVIDATRKEVPVANTLSRDLSLGCEMDVNHLRWYEKGWIEKRGCGAVVSVAGQDYIIVKRGIGSVHNCGGGESLTTPCVSFFIDTIGHPSFAWPTFDGKHFAPLPSEGNVKFIHDPELNNLVVDLITHGIYKDSIGSTNDKALAFELQNVVFPVSGS